jgi:hypothetical protein
MAPLPREDTVEKELDELKRGIAGTPIPTIADAIATNGNVGAVWVIHFRTKFTYHPGVTCFLPFVRWNVLVIDEKEGVSSCHMLSAGGIPSSNALAERFKLIGVQGIPRCFVTGITMELAMLKRFTNGRVED